MIDETLVVINIICSKNEKSRSVLVENIFKI